MKQSVRELLEQELNKRFYITHQSLTVDDLFKCIGIAEWTKSLFSTQKMDVLYQRIEVAPPVRLLHAVSTYLLGIAVREGMGLNFSSLPRIFSVSSVGDAFYFFWSGICLCHDLGYAYEKITDSAEQIQMLSCEGRRQLLNIEYDLLDLKPSDYPSELTAEESAWVEQTLLLTQNYNCYRLEGIEKTHQRIDHGIAGAVILYDALRRQARKGSFGPAVSGEFATNANHSRFDACCLLMACTIARHNMWIASDPASIEHYKKFGLDSLCKGANLNLVSAENAEEQMLFMLDFMDTIDPVKNLYVRAAEDCSTNPNELEERRCFLLDNIYISFAGGQNFDYRWAEFLPNHQMMICAECSTENEIHYLDEYQHHFKGLSDWLSIKDPHIRSSTSGTTEIVCYYPRQRCRETSWPGGITRKEIDSICLYEGNCVPGKAGLFYQLPNAYQTFNLLMMEGLDGENIRICTEMQSPNGIYIREWQRTLEVFTDIFHAQCRYYSYAAARDKPSIPLIQGYRVDRKLNVDMMQNQCRTFAFTSISKNQYLSEIAKGKKDLVLLKVTADGVFPYVDFADILKENYVYAQEAEILLPPFLDTDVNISSAPLSETENTLHGLNGSIPVCQYDVHFHGFHCEDIGRDPYILIENLERNKETAADTLESICAQRKIVGLPERELQCYLDWKENFRFLVQKCFYTIWESC